MRALGVIYRELPDRPDLAFRFLERREPGFARAATHEPEPDGPLVIQL